MQDETQEEYTECSLLYKMMQETEPKHTDFSTAYLQDIFRDLFYNRVTAEKPIRMYMWISDKGFRKMIQQSKNINTVTRLCNKYLTAGKR